MKPVSALMLMCPVWFGGILNARGIVVKDPNNASLSKSVTVLKRGETLSSGQSLKNGPFELKMQFDGNLVLFNAKHRDGNVAIWASNSNYNKNKREKKAPYRLELQNDGHLVIYDNEHRAIWWTQVYRDSEHEIKEHEYKTKSPWLPDTRLVLEETGNLVQYNDKDGNRMWHTNTEKDQLTADGKAEEAFWGRGKKDDCFQIRQIARGEMLARRKVTWHPKLDEAFQNGKDAVRELFVRDFDPRRTHKQKQIDGASGALVCIGDEMVVKQFNQLHEFKHYTETDFYENHFVTNRLSLIVPFYGYFHIEDENKKKTRHFAIMPSTFGDHWRQRLGTAIKGYNGPIWKSAARQLNGQTINLFGDNARIGTSVSGSHIEVREDVKGDIRSFGVNADGTLGDKRCIKSWEEDVGKKIKRNNEKNKKSNKFLEDLQRTGARGYKPHIAQPAPNYFADLLTQDLNHLMHVTPQEYQRGRPKPQPLADYSLLIELGGKDSAADRSQKTSWTLKTCGLTDLIPGSVDWHAGEYRDGFEKGVLRFLNIYVHPFFFPKIEETSGKLKGIEEEEQDIFN